MTQRTLKEPRSLRRRQCWVLSLTLSPFFQGPSCLQECRQMGQLKVQASLILLWHVDTFYIAGWLVYFENFKLGYTNKGPSKIASCWHQRDFEAWNFPVSRCSMKSTPAFWWLHSKDWILTSVLMITYNVTHLSSSTVSLGSASIVRSCSCWSKSFMTSNKSAVGLVISLVGVFSIDRLLVRLSSLSDSYPDTSEKINRCGLWYSTPVSYDGGWRKRPPADKHSPVSSAMLGIPKTVISTVLVTGLIKPCWRIPHAKLSKAISSLVLPTCWRSFNV